MRKIMIAGLLILALMMLALTAWAESEIKVELVGEALVGGDVELKVTAPGATECRVQWYDKNGDDIGMSYHTLEDGVGYFYSLVEEVTTETIVVYAEIDGQTCSSDPLVINYTANGRLTDIPTITAADTLAYGQPYTVSWTPVQGAECYRVYLRHDDVWWRMTTEETSATFSERAVMYLGQQSEYTVKVIALCTGMEPTTAEKTVAGEGGPDSRVTLNISNQNAGACEWINFTVTAPGAEQVALVLNGEEHLEEGDTYDVGWLWYGPANVEAYGKACYDGQWVAFTEEQYVTITSQGKVETPEITWPAELPLDTELELFVGSAEHAAQNNGVSVIISDQDKNWLITLWDIEPGVIRCDTSLFDPGEYSIEVRIIGEPGWQANFFYGSFTVVGERPAAPTLTTDKTEYAFSDLIKVDVSAENAEKFMILYEGYDLDGNKLFDNGSGQQIQAYDGKNTYGFKAHQGNATVNVQARALIGGVWSNACEPLVVSVGPSLGKLTEPIVTMPEEIVLGEDLTITLTGPDQAEWFWLSIYDSNDNYVLGKEVDGLGTHVIQTNIQTPGLFEVWIWSEADEWESSHATQKSLKVSPSEQSKCGENVYWSLSDDGTLTISGTGKMFSYYSEATPWGYDIKKVVVERGVTRVGGCAFLGCNQLESVSLPEGLTGIGKDAFGGCVNLKTILLPSTVTELRSNALGWTMQGVFCYADTDAEMWCMNHGFTVFTVDRGVLKLPAGTKTIESEAFAGLAGNLIVEIPDSVTSIAQDAFTGTTVAFRCNDRTAAASFAQANDIPRVPD